MKSSQTMALEDEKRGSLLSMEEFGVAYTIKDLILYALAIGFGSSNNDNKEGAAVLAEEELRFLYERHPSFVAVPTFCLSLAFWAGRGAYARTIGLPPFPPATMAEILPRRLVKGDLDISSFPLIHTWQSVVWHQSLPVPNEESRGRSDARRDSVIRTKLGLRTIAVQPKSIGTFVTTETIVTLIADDVPTGNAPTKSQNQTMLLCTMQSTALILGAPRDQIMLYNDELSPLLTSRPKIPDSRPPLLEWTIPISSDQALLYRLASGDTNHIHVDDSTSQMLGSAKKAPLLHGLCTLGIAYRALSTVINTKKGETVRKLEAKFTQPVFVGDVMCVKIWKSEHNHRDFIPFNSASGKESFHSTRHYVFVVCNQETGATVIDCGSAEIGSTPITEGAPGLFPTNVSKL
jgi:acyl dehydratase